MPSPRRTFWAVPSALVMLSCSGAEARGAVESRPELPAFARPEIPGLAAPAAGLPSLAPALAEAPGIAALGETSVAASFSAPGQAELGVSVPDEAAAFELGRRMDGAAPAPGFLARLGGRFSGALRVGAAAAALSSLALPSVADAEPGRQARYNEVYRTVTHNSYWVKRANVVEAFASGAQERLLDQLLFEGARGLEIDIHKDPARPGQWKVYHTDRTTNALCSPFTECLKQLRQFQYALPQHEAVTVVIELKEILGHNWDERHSPRDFDALLEKELGPHLYRPKDLLARCAPGATLRACVAEKGWPTIQEMRGKFVFAVLGNWRWGPIGHGGSDWAEYATWNGDGKGAVAARSAWPMATDISDFSQPSWSNEHVPADKLKAAREASVLLQVENLNDPAHLAEVGKFLAHGGVVRAGETFGVEDQKRRIAWGAQMFQTDYPWLQFNARGPAQPFRPLRPGDFDGPEQFQEPGERLALSREGPGAGYAFAFREEKGSSGDWETVPSSTRPSPRAAYPNPRWVRGKGCLRAEGAGGSFSVCRQTVDGRWNKRKPLGEDVVVTVEIERGGKTEVRRFVSDGHTSRGGVGDQLRLSLRRASDGKTCAAAFSAAEIGPDGRPAWTPLAEQCFDGGLARQGVSAQWGDVLFFRTRHDGAPVAASSLSASGPESGYSLADRSVKP